jgi:hypothetical protein
MQDGFAACGGPHPDLGLHLVAFLDHPPGVLTQPRKLAYVPPGALAPISTNARRLQGGQLCL